MIHNADKAAAAKNLLNSAQGGRIYPDCLPQDSPQVPVLTKKIVAGRKGEGGHRLCAEGELLWHHHAVQTPQQIPYIPVLA